MQENIEKAFKKWHRENQIYPKDESAIGYANRYANAAFKAGYEAAMRENKGVCRDCEKNEMKGMSMMCPKHE